MHRFLGKTSNSLTTETETIVSSIELLSKNSGNSCSVIIKKTTHIARLPTGIRGYVEIPTTILILHHYRINDLIKLITSIINTYQPSKTEQINVKYQDMNQPNSSFGGNHNELYQDPTINDTICKVQPSQRVAPRVFPLHYFA